MAHAPAHGCHSSVWLAQPAGLAAFGQEGVEAVLALLRRELEMVMTEMGTRDLASIVPASVRRANAGFGLPAGSD